MAADMDIEMDLDVGLMEDPTAPEIELVQDIDIISPDQTLPVLSTVNDTSGMDSQQLTPEKVHIRGVDNLTTKNIYAFAAEHFSQHKPLRVEWIDDTSANLLYETAEIAAEALMAFTTFEIGDVSQIPALQSIGAKPFSGHPEASLEVRLAVAGDCKQAGARDRSRFYLFNPEHDPAERRKRGNKYRERDDGGYRSQRYDDREQRKRQEGDATAGFDESLYDDDSAALAKRASGRRTRDSSSGSDSRIRGRGRRHGGAGRELFPEHEGESGRLRNRSASPMRDNEWESGREARRQDSAAAANREKAKLIKASRREAETTRELFPQKTNTKHRRSDAFDAADETADLFSNRISIPLTDGSNDERLPSLASRVTNRHSTPNGSSFNIRGAAKPQPQTFTIKGAAAVKELFPATLGDNSGKELFSERLEGRGRRRQKAEDLFH